MGAVHMGRDWGLRTRKVVKWKLLERGHSFIEFDRLKKLVCNAL